ncbi:placenta-specific gene 8 protein-like [Symsagittifera roscoffensis]|uniref:placenta-specific gene 8 protein-like n=1 Tax=Symsagittifera roscoffensis TaxID=84072 RepID=UPI00307C14A6
MESKMDAPPQYASAPPGTYAQTSQPLAYHQPYAHQPQQQYAPQQQQQAYVQPSNVNVVVQQPTPQKIYVEARNYPLPRSWKSGLFGCFDDCGNCLLTWFCGPCMLCSAASRMGESMCIVCFTPHPLSAMRTKTRMMYGIHGSLCDDCCVATFCYPCAQCQMQHQLSHMVELP